MTQTQHTTRSCTSSSSSDLQHAQQRRRRQMSTQLAAVLLLLLISCSATHAAAAATAQSRFFYTAADVQGKLRPQRQTNGAAAAADVEAADATSCCQGAAAASAEPVTIALELGNVTADYGETDGSSESSKETFKRSVASAIRNATPAICSPQPTIVELKPLTEQAGEQTAGNVYYSPACTRINRCNGCCGSTLISCQPTQVETLQLRVRKVERFGASSKRGYAIVNVDQHLACKCDCRIKAEDCNAYQEYRKDLCRCECQNTDARDKCLAQSDHKYWDDANCTCACRYNQSCTTGTVFDETQCKCTDPSAPSTDFADRRRFIVQAVAVEPDNSTLYSV